MGMMVNIENLLRKERSDLPDMGFIDHLKQIRRAVKDREWGPLEEFFGLYVFDDGEEALTRPADATDSREDEEERA